MSGLRVRAAAVAALMCVTVLLVFLLWRGLKAESSAGRPGELTWREADEADLF